MSLFACYCRDTYPLLLAKKQRGKYYNPNSFPAKFGQQEVAEGVEGVDLLEAYERGDIELDENGELMVLCTNIFDANNRWLISTL